MFERLIEALPIRQPKGLPPTRVFFLKADDNITSLLDRLDWAGASRVILVFPPDSVAVTDRLDLLRLIRRATRDRISVAFVTADLDRAGVARALGIPVFGSVELARNRPWRSRPSFTVVQSAPRQKRPHPSELRPGESRLAGFILLGMAAGLSAFLMYDLLTLSSLDLPVLRKDGAFGVLAGVAAGVAAFLLSWLMRRYLPRLFDLLRWTFMTLFFCLGILAPLATGYLVVPGARLTLSPARLPLSAIARITVVVATAGDERGLEEIDFEGLRIPGRRVSAEVGGEAVAAATGASEVPSSRASGTVVFSNLLPQDYTVGKNTTVRTSAGTPVRFVTTGDVTVPPLGQAAVGIEAVEPGPLGNVDIGLINQVEGATARAVRVTNPEPTRGGGVSQVRAVTQADREALRRSVLAELRAQGYQRVMEISAAEGGLQEGEYLVPGSVKVLQVLHETYDRFATEEAESVKLEMRVLVTGIMVDLGDAYNLARYVLSERVPDEYELIEVEYRPGLMGDNVIGDGTLTFFVEVEGVAEAQLRHDQVKRWLSGKSREEGLALLASAQQSGELPVNKQPEVQIWPTWAADRFPRLIWRIQVAELADE